MMIESPYFVNDHVQDETLYDSEHHILEHSKEKSLPTPIVSHDSSPLPFTAAIMPLSTSSRTFTIVGKGRAAHIQDIQNRLFHWSVYEPTGIFCRANEQIRIQLHGNQSTTAYIGTFNYPQGGHRPTARTLNPGVNTISSPTAGLLYINDEHAIGTTLTVDVENGGIASPLFILGRHSQQDFQHMLNTMTASGMIELRGNRSLVTVSRQFGLSHVTGRDPSILMRLIDATIENQDECSGLDPNMPHERDRPDLHYKAFTEDTRPNVFMWASNFSTGYRSASLRYILDPHFYQHNGWGPWHEQGHTRQLTSWLWHRNSLIETTVNIYTLFTERDFDQYPMNRVERDGRYTTAFNYFNQLHKDFHSLDVFVKLLMFWQLDLAFGRNFYPTLHRLYRALPMDALPGINWHDVGLQFFIYMTSLATNRNLAPYFEMWGLRPSVETLTRISAFPPLGQDIWRSRDTAPVVEYIMPKPGSFTADNLPTLPNVNQVVPYLDSRRVNILTVLDANSNAALQVNNNQTRLWGNTNATNQQFEFIRDAATNTYTIRNIATNSFLTESGSNITLTNTPTNNARWQVFPRILGSYVIINQASGRALDVEGGSTTANGTRVLTWGPSGNGNQAWMFRYIDGQANPDQQFIPPLHPIKPDGSGGQTDGDNESAMFDQQYLQLATALNGTARMQPNGSDLVLWAPTHEKRQIWHFTFHPATQSYTLQNVEDGRYLSEVNHTVAFTNTATSNHARWRLVQGASNTYQLINVATGRSLDVEGGNTTANGTRVITWTSTGNPNQRWHLNVVAAPTTPEPEIPPVQPEQQHFLITTALNGTSVIEPSGNNLVLWSRRHQNNQLWTFEQGAHTDTYLIRNVADHRLLTETNHQLMLGTAVTDHARWRILLHQGDQAELQNLATNRFIDVSGGTTATNGTAVITWSRNNGLNQRWLIEPVTGEGSVFPEPEIPTPTLQPPTHLRENGRTSNSITLDWSLPEAGASRQGFRIFRNNGLVGTVGANTTRFVDTGLAANTTFNYRVATFDQNGNEATSPTLSVATLAIQPPEPELPQPSTNLTYRITGEGTTRQQLVITNRTGNNIPSRWNLALSFTGGNPATEWPADWRVGANGNLSTVVNAGLNNNGSLTLPMGVATNTRITNVMVNGTPATRES